MAHHRQQPMNHLLRPLSTVGPALLVAALVVGACSGATPSASSVSSANPSPAASGTAPTPTRSFTATPVTSEQEAVARVIAFEPRLVGIKPKDDQLIGQSAWYEVTPASGLGAFLVRMRVGWGDCQAGCIDEHLWTYAVAPDGTVTLQQETGDPVAPDAWPVPQTGQTGLRLTAFASPTCPVEQPGDPACAPRVVPGATIVIRDASGAEAARVTLDDQGTAFVALAPGAYTVEAGPVQGLMGTPAAIGATVTKGVSAPLILAYDTGIR